MEILVRTISGALDKKPFCMVPYGELERVWPGDQNRMAKVAVFACEHDWQLYSCIEGLGAVIMRKDYTFNADLAGFN